MNVAVLNSEEVNTILETSPVPFVKTFMTVQTSEYFSIQTSDTIKTSIQTNLGLDLFGTENVPIRWVRGDASLDCDQSFQTLYLIFITDSTGSCVIDGVSYPIQNGHGFTVQGGSKCEMIGTGNSLNLIIRVPL
jgi:hypothetical protein